MKVHDMEVNEKVMVVKKYYYWYKKEYVGVLQFGRTKGKAKGEMVPNARLITTF